MTGFTLIELMVAVAIIAVIAVIGAVGFGGGEGRVLCFETDRLCGTVSQARLDALSSGVDNAVIFRPSAGEYLAFRDENDNGLPESGEVYSRSALGGGVEFGASCSRGPGGGAVPDDGVSFVSDCLRFNSMGSCRSGTVYLRHEGIVHAVRVYPSSGAVRVWEYRKGWADR